MTSSWTTKQAVLWSTQKTKDFTQCLSSMITKASSFSTYMFCITYRNCLIGRTKVSKWFYASFTQNVGDLCFPSKENTKPARNWDNLMPRMWSQGHAPAGVAEKKRWPEEKLTCNLDNPKWGKKETALRDVQSRSRTTCQSTSWYLMRSAMAHHLKKIQSLLSLTCRPHFFQ